MLSHTFWGRILAGNRSRGWISSILAIKFTDKTDQKHRTFKWISPEPKLPATLICSALWASLLLPDPAGRLLLVFATVVSAQPRGSASTSALPLVFRQERPAGLNSCPVYFGREAAAPNSSGSLGTLAAPHPPPVHGSDKSAIPDVLECIQLFDCCPLDAASERPRVQKPFHCIYDLGS